VWHDLSGCVDDLETRNDWRPVHGDSRAAGVVLMSRPGIRSWVPLRSSMNACTPFRAVAITSTGGLMVSGLAWLDASQEEQRRAREMLRLFAQTESRDELGLGQIRDVFSDLLFPGTSVLHTRARYFLFVPWCHQVVSGRGESELAERQLVATLLKAGFTEGLIGSRRGPAVRTLPSAIYRAAMRRYGILDDTTSEAVEAERGDERELIGRGHTPWHRELPTPPARFPHTVEHGFDLSAAEASWLRERVLGNTQGSMLEFLLLHRDRSWTAASTPWEDPICREADSDLGRVRDHAELFSRTMHGALLLYNLLLGRKYEAAGYSEVAEPVDVYRNQLADWADRTAGDPRIDGWDLVDLWDLVLRHNPRVSLASRAFVEAWIDVCRDPHAVADDHRAHGLVAARERLQKKNQARLVNGELLRRWNGASGVRPMTFRWAQAVQLVTDIRDGIEGARAAT
jgi:hypothetical protein